MKKLIITSLMAGICLQIQAQNHIEALRYSGKKFGSTAKSMAIGGAVGALGADISSASVNPASLAQYKKGEFSFSLGFIGNQNTSTYFNNQVTDNTFKLNIPNAGLVFVNKSHVGKGKKGWKNSTIAFNAARVADFTRVVNFSGTNTSSSLMDYFAERANGYSIAQIRATDDDFDNGFSSKTTMAWEGYLIDSVGDRKYAANASPIFHDITQKGVTTQSGGMYEYNMSYAGNYSDIFYLGGTLTYTSVKFKEARSHTEINDPRNNGNQVVNNFIYSENLTTTGGGWSAQMGLVICPVKFVRLGASLQTPMVLKLNDSYNFSLNSNLNNGENYNYKSKDGSYSYKLQTPFRYNFSAVVVAGKLGFISGDFESVDYSAARLRSNDGNTAQAMETANDGVRSLYTRSYNYRIGAELVNGDFRYRGGYANYGSPFIGGTSNQKSEFITGGIGIKQESWSLDFALIHQMGNDVYQPYTLNDKSKVAAVSDNSFKANSLLVTLSTRF